MLAGTINLVPVSLGDLHTVWLNHSDAADRTDANARAALLWQRRQPTLCFAPIVAGAVFNGATHERVGTNRNAVVVPIPTLHHIAENQSVTTATVEVGGAARVFADGDDELQSIGGIYRFVVRNSHEDRFAKPVLTTV